MKRIEFPANIKDGILHIVDREDFARQVRETFDEGTVVDVVVEKKRRRRSIQQNKYLWAVVYSLIAEHAGYTTDEVNEWVKQEFLDGKQVEIGGKIHEAHTSTKDLNTVEFETLTERLRRWSAEFLNCTIPEPNQTEWTE